MESDVGCTARRCARRYVTALLLSWVEAKPQVLEEHTMPSYDELKSVYKQSLIQEEDYPGMARRMLEQAIARGAETAGVKELYEQVFARLLEKSDWRWLRYHLSERLEFVEACWRLVEEVERDLVDAHFDRARATLQELREGVMGKPVPLRVCELPERPFYEDEQGIGTYTNPRLVVELDLSHGTEFFEVFPDLSGEFSSYRSAVEELLQKRGGEVYTLMLYHLAGLTWLRQSVTLQDLDKRV